MDTITRRDKEASGAAAGADARTIRNPILPGFNPDPAILRVENDFYIATSTFEWFPGVCIHHSRDLVNWELRGHALDRVSQLDMRGNPRSGGVWAPCLTYDDGLFYLIYTDVKAWGHGFLDAHNYLVTAPSIDGPWSEPIYLNSSGFDPSLFHDEDGRKWVTNMLWDHRLGETQFGGILLQEYSPQERALVGPVENIFKGSALGVTEGPHIYRRDGHYYLLVAEGGTSWEHAVSVARSRSIHGPYEVAPNNPLLTSAERPDLYLQKAGHGSIVETPDGRWYLAHLCGRPISEHRRCVLGRETAIQEIEWGSDGWPRMVGGGNAPRVKVRAPGLPEHVFAPQPERVEFDEPVLPVWFQTLRVPGDESWLSLTARPGHLRLVGRESPRSLHRQSMVARRITSTRFRASTRVDFRPESFQQMAGLICWYDDENYFYLAIAGDEALSRCLTVFVADQGKHERPITQPIALPDSPYVHLRATSDGARVVFSWASDGENWNDLRPSFDLSQLSDEYTTLGLGFTGAFVGMCAHDLTGRRAHADFDDFEYADQESAPVAPGE